MFKFYQDLILFELKGSREGGKYRIYRRVYQSETVEKLVVQKKKKKFDDENITEILAIYRKKTKISSVVKKLPKKSVASFIV